MNHIEECAHRSIFDGGKSIPPNQNRHGPLHSRFFGWRRLGRRYCEGLDRKLFVSIHEGRLLGRVGTTLINQNSLPELIENMDATTANWAARSYYQALISEDASHFYEDDFEGLGRVELRVLRARTIRASRNGAKQRDEDL